MKPKSFLHKGGTLIQNRRNCIFFFCTICFLFYCLPVPLDCSSGWTFHLSLNHSLSDYACTDSVVFYYLIEYNNKGMLFSVLYYTR